MNVILYLLTGATVLVLALIAILVGAGLTGRASRAYEVLHPAETVEIAGETTTASSLAKRYAPIMHLRSTTPSPALLSVGYNVVPTETALDVVYYFVWEDEIHPNAAVNALYSIYRAFFYGYPLFDIEYFQISVDRRTGEVKRLLFETSSEDDYFAPLSEHIVASYEAQEDGSYLETLTAQRKQRGRQRVASVQFEGRRVLVGVQTWNHLTKLLESGNEGFDVVLDAPIRHLTSEEYSRYKLARRSQGDHRTEESGVSRWLATLATFVLLALPGWFLAGAMRKRRGGSGKEAEA